MAGQILGAYFKAVLGAMLGATASVLFPQHRKRINEMSDQAWYPWDDYVQMANDLHARLGDVTISALGQQSVEQTLPLNKAAGFDSLDKVFRDFDALAKNVVKDVPPSESIRTVSFTKGLVVLESDTRLPPALLTGVFRGFLLGFGKVVTSESVERTGNTVRFTLKWV